MEMHQVRYFLALAETQNFTRAAAECNVAQPSLTRAIKQLECELGGDLFLRERPSSQLTELGQRMRPFLQQCYAAATEARSAASSFAAGEVGTLKIALSRTIDLALLMPFLGELSRTFKGLAFKFHRGSADDVAELMKSGEAELGIVAARSDEWGRLDMWPLFSEAFDFAVSRRQLPADDTRFSFDDFKRQTFVQGNYCEQSIEIGRMLRDQGFESTHEVSSERDLIGLIEAGFGVAALPRSTASSIEIRRVDVDGFTLRRTVFLYGVAGRQRSAVAATLAKMMRAANWQTITANLHS